MEAIHEKKRTPNHQLRHQRELRGWSEREVALKLQERFPQSAASARDVKRWENGERMPGPFYRPKLCVLFGATEDQLDFRPQDVSLDQHLEEGETAQEEGRQTDPEAPTIEEVICRFTELFHQQQAMVHQVLRWYEQTNQLLEENGLQPAEVIKDLAERLRAEKQQPIQPLPNLSSMGAPVPQEIAPPFSPLLPQNIMEASVSKLVVQSGASDLPATDSDCSLMQQPATAWTNQEQIYFSLSTEQVTLLFSLDRGDDPMAFDQSKRDTLQSIAATILTASGSSALLPFAMSDPEPWERLVMAQKASSPSTILNAATLEHFKNLLTISWQLCDGNQLTAAEGVLMGFLPQLLSLPKQELDTAFLVSHGLRLQSVLTHHHLRLSDKVRLCEQSVNYARQAGNANTLATALLELIWAYKYAKQPEKYLEPLQELLSLSHQVSPLVRSRIYSRYSVILAESGRIREAEFYIGLAQESLPDDPMKDPGFAFTDSSVFFFSYCAGLVCIRAGSIPQAFQAFEYYKQHPSGVTLSERHRLEIANGQSQAAILDNDAEKYAGLLEDVLVGSVLLRSQKRFDEALGIFQKEMPTSWLSFSRIKQLSEQYGLKREA